MTEAVAKDTNGQGTVRKSALKILFPVMGIIGIGISGYLTYIHYQNLGSICFFNANCDAVLTSPYSQIWSVPLALFGLVMYVVITILGFLLLSGRKEWNYVLAMGIYGLALASLLFSIYLYYLEIFEIHAFCTWCIGSSIVVLVIFVGSLINLSAEGFSLKEYLHRLNIERKRYIQW